MYGSLLHSFRIPVSRQLARHEEYSLYGEILFITRNMIEQNLCYGWSLFHLLSLQDILNNHVHLCHL